jgi:chaperone LolA
MNDVRGKFAQTSHLKDLERVERYEGEFFIKKPSSMRWIFSKPRDEEIIIREGNLWIYKKSEKQALKSTFNKDTYAQVPIALMNSLDDLTTDFEIKLMKDKMLELTPKKSMGVIKHIHLEVNALDFPIKKFIIFDSYGNIVEIEVLNAKINPGLEDSLFMFNPQPDVEVFDISQ